MNETSLYQNVDFLLSIKSTQNSTGHINQLEYTHTKVLCTKEYILINSSSTSAVIVVDNM